jgi:hypothetical protein
VRRTRLGLVVVIGGLLVAGAGLSGCASQPQLPGSSELPGSFAGAPLVVRQAYAYAHDHPDVLKALPCYCGCGTIGHTSNYDCYIAGIDDSGELVYDGHALACSICVDITLDARRLLDQGLSLEEVRAQIDVRYSPFGPSNMPGPS